MQIFVRMVTGSFALEVERSDTVKELKKKVQDVKGVPCYQQRLVYGGKDLKDGIPLSEYNVLTNSTIELRLRLIGGACMKFNNPASRKVEVNLKINTPNCKKMAFDIAPSDKFQHIKEFLDEKNNTPSKQLRIIYTKKMVMSNKTADDNYIQGGVMLRLALTLRGRGGF